MIIVTRAIAIDRPLAVVGAQFADVAHHERSGPHRRTRFTVIDESLTFCDYEQRTRQGLVTITQRFHLDRADLAHQTNTVTSGPFTGGMLTFDLEASEAAQTTVRATLRSERPLMRFAAPVLGRILGRSLARALAEDKHDLESGAYPSDARSGRVADAHTLDP